MMRIIIIHRPLGRSHARRKMLMSKRRKQLDVRIYTNNVNFYFANNYRLQRSPSFRLVLEVLANHPQTPGLVLRSR
jgi:hypothetical protein